MRNVEFVYKIYLLSNFIEICFNYNYLLYNLKFKHQSNFNKIYSVFFTNFLKSAYLYLLLNIFGTLIITILFSFSLVALALFSIVSPCNFKLFNKPYFFNSIGLSDLLLKFISLKD